MAFPDNAACPDCGITVRRHAGLLLDRLAGDWVLDAGGNQLVRADRAWTAHRCDPDEAAHHRAAVEAVLADTTTWVHARLAELPEGGDLPQAASQRLAESQARIDALIAEHSLAIPCDKCRVRPGDRCENLVERRRGNRVLTARPHNERMPPPTTRIGQRLELARTERDERYRELERLRGIEHDRNRLTLMLELLSELATSRPEEDR